MGLLDDVRKGTGIGLKPAEAYARAYEKGVLLGPAKYGEAIALFQEAAQTAHDSRDMETQARATANAYLYSFVVNGNLQSLAELARVLPRLPQIEQIGSRTEMMPTGALVAEVNARLLEGRIAQMNAADHGNLAAAHQDAARAFKDFFNYPLITYRYHASDGLTQTAQSRFFFHQGLSDWHQALNTVSTSPETAAEHMAKALNAFRQSGEARWAADAEAWLANCRRKRTCWVCHREFQGATVHFRSFSAIVTPHVQETTAALGQDMGMLDVQQGYVVLCTPCSSVVERLADVVAVRRTQELRVVLETQIAALNRAIHGLAAIRR